MPRRVRTESYLEEVTNEDKTNLKGSTARHFLTEHHTIERRDYSAEYKRKSRRRFKCQ
jgi:hypothetical protein